MKKFLTLFILTLSVCFSWYSNSQTTKTTIDPQNMRESESVEYCTTHKKMKVLLNDPIAKQKYTTYQNEIAKIIQSKSGSSIEKSTIYRIPIVFHVLHNGGVENISNQQIMDGLAILNRDFRMKNSDAADVVTDFKGLPVDVGIEFVLASKAPDGSLFCGITRTKSAISYDGSDGQKQVDSVIAGNDVYQGEWPGDQYLNVFICGEIGGAAGYTRNPNDDVFLGTGMGNGIWILHNYVGSIGTSSIQTSRTLTHETGHWLNLSHVWGSNNNPGIECGDDDVSDTPITKGHTSCNLLDAACNPPIVENIENYMEYSYCSKMFTQGQKDRMRASLQSSTGGRDVIWNPNNLLITGVSSNSSTICKADFKISKTVICPGESVTFSDLSYSTPTSWSWKTTGGTPSSSTLQNPTITYNTPGSYTVTLTASANGTSDDETKTNIIEVLSNSSSPLPFYEGFESYTSNTMNNWSIYDQNNDRAFELATGVGYASEKCVKLSNFDETNSSTIDELISSSFDLSGINSTEKVTLSFKCSYRKKKSTTSESLKLLVTDNCGGIWNTRKTMSSSFLSNVIESTPWTPTTTNNWLTVHVTSITNTYFTSNFRFKFQFVGNGGNNIYLDDINLYKGNPSDTIVLGLSENQISIENELILFPNPTEGELNVRFSIALDDEIQLQIQDISGKTVQNQFIKANKGTNLVILNTENLANGLYFLTTKIGNSKKTMQFVAN